MRPPPGRNASRTRIARIFESSPSKGGFPASQITSGALSLCSVGGSRSAFCRPLAPTNRLRAMSGLARRPGSDLRGSSSPCRTRSSGSSSRVSFTRRRGRRSTISARRRRSAATSWSPVRPAAAAALAAGGSSTSRSSTSGGTSSFPTWPAGGASAPGASARGVLHARARLGLRGPLSRHGAPRPAEEARDLRARVWGTPGSSTQVSRRSRSTGGRARPGFSSSPPAETTSCGPSHSTPSS